MEIAFHAGIGAGSKRMLLADKPTLAQEFEALLLAQMWRAAATGEGGHGMDVSNGEQIFRSMLLQQQTTHMARAGGIGLADLVQKGMTR